MQSSRSPTWFEPGVIPPYWADVNAVESTELFAFFGFFASKRSSGLFAFFSGVLFFLLLLSLLSLLYKKNKG